jgi:hypothetical protein
MTSTSTQPRTGLQPQTRKLQVKLFVQKDPSEAEKEVGLWLRQHDVCVAHITQSQSEQGGRFVFILSLFYYSAH